MTTTALHIPQGNLFDINNESNYNRFLEFHAKYPKVYELFEKFTLQLIYNGHTRLGAKMIIERIRWEMATDGSKDAKGFKINNNYTCFYSRLFVRKNPKHSKIFEFREVKN